MTNTVAIKGVTKCYGAIEAVRDVSFDLPAGEAIALVGHNGAGKTTLLKLMLGLIQPTAGTIRVLGENPAAGEFAARRGLGYLPESVSFNAALTGREILTFYARLKGEPVTKSLELLDKVGLGPASARRVGTYSKGMRQRLGLAQALIGAPKILLLDEPTTGLDPALRLSFYKIVQELRNHGTTVVLSSHALTEIEERTERVIIMNRGVMVAHGSIDELRRIASLPTRIRLKRLAWRQRRDGDLACPGGKLASGEQSPHRNRCGTRSEDRIAAPGHGSGRTLRRCRGHAAHTGRALRAFPPDAGRAALRNILIIAGKEIQEGLRNRWVLATTLLLAALALTLTFLGSAPTGNVGVRALDVLIVSLSSLTIFLLPLIALLISHDAIVGEMERGTMLLLLSYPVGRWQVVFGKFVGHLTILAFATILGYGAAALALSAMGAEISAESWIAFAAMVGSSVMLGAVFIAIGYLVSARVRDRGHGGRLSGGPLASPRPHL